MFIFVVYPKKYADRPSVTETTLRNVGKHTTGNHKELMIQTQQNKAQQAVTVTSFVRYDISNLRQIDCVLISWLCITGPLWGEIHRPPTDSLYKRVSNTEIFSVSCR